MQKTLLKQYASIEAQFKSLEAKKKATRELIVEEMSKHKLEKIESDYGNFTIGSRLSWTYSEAIAKKEEALKIAKDKEQKKGTAISSETKYLLYKKPENE